MGTSFQVVIAAGAEAGVREAIADAGQEASVRPIGEQRWAVVPVKTDDDAYAETDELARLSSRPPGATAASIQVFDSDVLVAGLYRAGRHRHDYLSDQAYLMEFEDDDGTEILIDLLGRPYTANATPPTGPYGPDPAAFRPLGVGPVDESAVAAALTATGIAAELRFDRLLRALNLTAADRW